MNAKRMTKLLTKVGFLFLERMGCFNVSTEVNIPPYDRIEQRLDNRTDKHHFIDLLGIQWEYLPPSKPYKGVNKRIVLRGIEIKVSKNDLKNGFIQSGCTFNYIMIPKGTIKTSDVPTASGVGIIEVDLKNLKIVKRKLMTNYEVLGVRIIRNAVRKTISEVTIDCCLRQIGETLTNQTKRWLVEELIKKRKFS